MINWVAARARAEFDDRLIAFDVRPPHYGVLSVIAAEPGLTQQELVERTSIDPSTMVVVVDALEAQGKAQRRPHPTDRRKRAVHLTAEGEALLPRLRAAAEATNDGVFAALTPGEIATLDRLLGKLAGVPAVDEAHTSERPRRT